MEPVESDYDRMFRVVFGPDGDNDADSDPDPDEDRSGPLTAAKAVSLVRKRIY